MAVRHNRSWMLRQPGESVLHCGVGATSAEQSHPASQLLDRGPGYLFAAHRNLVIAHWTAQGTGPLIAALAKTLGAFAPQHPEGMSNVHLIAEGVPLANAEAREALSALMKVHEGTLACAGTVIGGSGFWASATRGLIMSLQLMAPSSYAMRTCASDDEVIAWIQKPHARRTGVELDPEALGRAIAEVRALGA